LTDPHPELAKRHDEHRHVERKADEVLQPELAVHDHSPADEQHGRLREHRQKRHQGHVERALPVRLHALCKDGL
jgi:hypothetical protein